MKHLEEAGAAGKNAADVIEVRRERLRSKAVCSVSHRGMAEGAEGLFWLDRTKLGEPLRPDRSPALCVNTAWGTAEELLADPRPAFFAEKGRKARVNLLALGDVGGTVLIGLKLLGGDVISEIGICDMDPQVCRRWEYEMNQTAYPWDYDALPEVKIVEQPELFDCDVFVFCASKAVPALGAEGTDVRMVQFDANRKIVGSYARMAREAGFKGLFAVVSDPVEPLCREVFWESNRGETGVHSDAEFCRADGSGQTGGSGESAGGSGQTGGCGEVRQDSGPADASENAGFDGNGLRPEQIQGYGLGVMNGRAACYAKRNPRFESFLTEGRAFGPHGKDLVIANSIENYDDELSRSLTTLAAEANLRTRETGFKPYIAPALSSAAISILLTLRGEWHYSSIFLGGVYMGCKNRFGATGLETEALPLPEKLYGRLKYAYERLDEIE